MTLPSWNQTCINLVCFLPYGHLAQLEHFPLEKKMFAVLTFSSPKENVFLTRHWAGFPGKKHFPFGEEKVSLRTFSSPKENV